MRETEILRGLGKARSNRFADGMVPAKRPTLGQRVLGKMTGGLVGYDSSNDAKPVATSIALESEGAIGKTARTLRGRAKQIDDTIREAEGYKDGVVPYLDKSGIVHGPGTSTSDSVPAMLSDDEAVLPAKTVEAIGPANLARLIEETNGVAPQHGLNRGKYATGFVSNTIDATKKTAGSLMDKARALAPSPSPSPAPAPTVLAPKATVPVQPVARIGTDAVSSASRLAPPASVSPSAPTTSALKPTGAGFERIAGAGKTLANAARATASAGILPAATIMSAANSYNKPTEEFQKQTGIQNGLGARAAGVMQDLGNTLTFGLAGKAGEALARLQSGDTQPSAPAPTSVPAPTTPANTQLTGEIPASEVAATQDNTTAASQPAVSPFREAQDMLRASEFSRGESWQDRADKKALRGRAMDMANIINSDQSQENNRYATDSTFAANAANSQIKLAEFQNQLGQQASKKVDDRLRAMSVEPKAKGGSQFSADAYAKNTMALQQMLAENGMRVSDLDDAALSDFVLAMEAKAKQDEDNSGVLMQLGRAVGLADPASESRNPLSAAYQANEIDRNSVLGPKAVSRDMRGRVLNSIRLDDAAGGTFGASTNVDQLGLKQRQAAYRQQARAEQGNR